MHLSDFDFTLPEDLIALRPVRPRRASRLLHWTGGPEDRQVTDLPRLLRSGDLLVFNNTRVIPARLTGMRYRETADGSGAARIEATLIRRTGEATWDALARPAKRLAPGDTIAFGDLIAIVAEKREAGEIGLDFDRAGADLDSAIATVGTMPLPPYIAQRRAADAEDMEDYQTVFAERPGAVAAPTASLHFDPPLLDRLDAAGINTTRLTLHVGAGTFLPVKTDDISDHRMHAEWGHVPDKAAEAINRTRRDGGRVIPVGTTALRLIETAGASGEMRPWTGETDIFITPGYRWRMTDALMTNFHLPRSTLAMLVAALVGVDAWRALYAHAIAERYRFYSYGDSSLLWRPGA